MPAIKKNPSSAALAVPARQRRGHGRATLQDVAGQAGVTAITVSRFLRAPAIVAAETAQRIEAALLATGYVPNKQAGQLASGQSRMVAAIIPSIANSIFAETVQGLSDGLQEAGYELLLTSTGYSREREQGQIRAVLGWFPSALVVTGRHHSEAALALLRSAQAARTPVIEIWDQQPPARSNGFAQVGFNHAAVGRAMAEHLLAQGHRRLAYVDSGVSEDFRAHERGKGFVAAAKAAGATVRLVTAPPGDAFDAGRLALGDLLAADARVRALAFANDNLACGALLEAQQRGIPVPGQLALIGFGDFAIGRQLQPALTTIRPPRYEIGRSAAALLLAALERGAPLEAQALAWQLLPRDST
jgi:LacI family transcriptional regulator, gluconate utilization system Gnt-I transcriptional repressor